jgi:hypothetical protein
MTAVVGEESLSNDDTKHLGFLTRFENDFLQQGQYETRAVLESVDIAWERLRTFPKEFLEPEGRLPLVPACKSRHFNQELCGNRKVDDALDF